MGGENTDMPRPHFRHETCPAHPVLESGIAKVNEWLTKMDGKLDTIGDRLAEGNVQLARMGDRLGRLEETVWPKNDDDDLPTMRHRLRSMERIVYGSVALALISLAGAILSLVLVRSPKPAKPAQASGTVAAQPVEGDGG